MEKRKGEALTPEHYQHSVRTRLAELRERWGLSEIARRTHTPLTNVHRYMNEGKIPTEFCAALVDAFEVNPAWLLAGAGGALLSDVEPGTARLGGGLLELVNAMNSVSRLRLGALAGKEQEKSLRQLHEAMDTYERLREEMNARTRPVLAELLQRFAQHNREMQLDRAQGVRKAALSAARFCDDDHLLMQLDQLQANLEHLCGRVEAGLGFHSRVFARKLREGGLRDTVALDEAGNFVLALRDSARFEEGLRVCEAAIRLVTPEMRGHRLYAELEVIAAGFEVEMDRLYEGITRIQRWMNVIAPEHRSFPRILLARAEVLSGQRTIRELRATEDPSRGLTRLMMRTAGLMEDMEEVKFHARHSVGDTMLKVPPTEFETRRCQLLASMAGKRPKDPLKDYDEIIAAAPPPVNAPAVREVLIALHRAQLARLGGLKAKARELTLETQQKIEQVPADRSLTADLRGAHARNIRECLDDKHRGLKESTNQWLFAQIAKGYGLLRAILRPEEVAQTVAK